MALKSKLSTKTKRLIYQVTFDSCLALLTIFAPNHHLDEESTDYSSDQLEAILSFLEADEGGRGICSLLGVRNSYQRSGSLPERREECADTGRIL